MKKHCLKTVFALALGGAVSLAQAQVYVEGTYSPTYLKYNDGNQSKPLLFSGVLGYQLHPNVALEAHVGIHAKNGEYTSGSTVTTNRYDSLYGLFIRPSYPLNRKLDAFARVGQVQIKTKQSSAINGVASGTETQQTLNSVAWGLGLDYAFDTNMYLTGDYTTYYSRNGTKIYGLGLGLGYRF